jgi:formamidopyrimidine-DNA glycosylase
LVERTALTIAEQYMPELPDVEVFRQSLEAKGLRRRIVGVSADTREILWRVAPQSLSRQLIGRRLVGTVRHGKWLFADTRDGWLALHFGMTGSLQSFRDKADAPGYVRLQLDFADRTHLAFDDPRKFGRVSFIMDVSEFILQQHLGPDALSVGWRQFRQLLASRRGGLKAALMDQGLLAGLGNLYVDEILFQARLHPLATISELNEATLRGLYRTMRGVLKSAIRSHVDARRMPRSWLLPRREKGGTCPRCGGKLQRLRIGQRTTVICPRCQGRAVAVERQSAQQRR